MTITIVLTLTPEQQKVAEYLFATKQVVAAETSETAEQCTEARAKEALQNLFNSDVARFHQAATDYESQTPN